MTVGTCLLSESLRSIPSTPLRADFDSLGVGEDPGGPTDESSRARGHSLTALGCVFRGRMSLAARPRPPRVTRPAGPCPAPRIAPHRPQPDPDGGQRPRGGTPLSRKDLHGARRQRAGVCSFEPPAGRPRLRARSGPEAPLPPAPSAHPALPCAPAVTRRASRRAGGGGCRLIDDTAPPRLTK